MRGGVLRGRAGGCVRQGCVKDVLIGMPRGSARGYVDNIRWEGGLPVITRS